MTKRLASKHKVDRRLKSNLWGRPKSPYNIRNYPPGQHGKKKVGKTSDFKSTLFFKNLKFSQLQALVQQKRKKIRTCYMAQKKLLGLYFHTHFDSSPYDKN